MSQPQPVGLALHIGCSHLYTYFRAEKLRRSGQKLGKAGAEKWRARGQARAFSGGKMRASQMCILPPDSPSANGRIFASAKIAWQNASDVQRASVAQFSSRARDVIERSSMPMDNSGHALVNK
ncbi:MAG: hypothetical protein NTX79_00760 [Candidatus Micrarchaeota archaeon]|nr:hypothetical protein [Candidatus Micrarchaeota archaeon]